MEEEDEEIIDIEDEDFDDIGEDVIDNSFEDEKNYNNNVDATPEEEEILDELIEEEKEDGNRIFDWANVDEDDEPISIIDNSPDAAIGNDAEKPSVLLQNLSEVPFLNSSLHLDNNIPLTNPVLSMENDVDDDAVSRIDEELMSQEKYGPENLEPIAESYNLRSEPVGETLKSKPEKSVNVSENQTPDFNNKIIPQAEETSMTKQLRGLLQGYPGYFNFENKEDTFSLIKDIILIYKLLYFCETKSKQEDVRIKLQAMRKELDNKGVPHLIEYYNEFISRNKSFGMSRVRRRLDVFVNDNINFLMETIQYWLFVMPFRSKKDTHFDTAHGLPAASGDDMVQSEIEKGEKYGDLNLDTGFKIDDEGEVIPV